MNRYIKKYHIAYARITNTTLHINDSYYDELYNKTYGRDYVSCLSYMPIILYVYLNTYIFLS